LSFGEGDWSQRTIRLKSIEGCLNAQLCDLVDASSICALRLLVGDTDFILKMDPSLWADDHKYEILQKSVQSLSAVNDVAERSIALVTELNESPLTRNEEEFQKVIQVVEDNRRRLPDVRKDLLADFELY
jgi:hypothetical protein